MNKYTKGNRSVLLVDLTKNVGKYMALSESLRVFCCDASNSIVINLAA